MNFQITTETGCTLNFTDEPIYDSRDSNKVPGYRLTITDASGADMGHSHLIRKADIKRLAKAS
jgi:hypothetical protein